MTASVSEDGARRVRRRAEIWPCPAHIHVEKHKSVEMLCLSILFHCKRSKRKMIVPPGHVQEERRLLKIEYLDLDYKLEVASCQLKNWIRA